MKFDTTTYWFDTTYQGSTIDHQFRFVNKGKTPLIIMNCTGNSGCIVPTYPKEPIAPGKSGVIGVVFNTTGKMGMQDKCITVTSNASEPTIVLHIKGRVVPAPPPPGRIGPDPANHPNGPVISFDTTTFWFDTVAQGTVVIHEFRFQNTGKTPLIITGAPTGCGCMVAEYPKEPVAPRKTGVIKVTLSLAGKSGPQDKVVTLESNNTAGNTYLHMRGYVKVPSSPDRQR